MAVDEAEGWWSVGGRGLSYDCRQGRVLTLAAELIYLIKSTRKDQQHINTNMTADQGSTFELVPSDHPPIVEAVPTTDFTASGNEDENENENEDENENPSDTDIIVGCGVAGLIIGGPCLALITALGGNWAKKKQGPFGESTRAIGRITHVAGKKAKDEKFLHKVKASVASLFDDQEGVQV
eukprot:scaffold1480_cov106-Skeletonema_dohrnii-CCMP3373.AAC.2